jgi:hypothetical protein
MPAVWVGFGGGSLLVPIMFDGIGEKTFYVFGAAMFAYIPIIYCFFPETAGRTLEAMDFLFASKSLFTWDEEAEFRKRIAELENRVQGNDKETDSSEEKAVVMRVSEV